MPWGLDRLETRVWRIMAEDAVAGPAVVRVWDGAGIHRGTGSAAADDGRAAAGILLGHHRDRPRPVLDVVHAGDTGSRAIREATPFQWDVAYAQALAELVYRTDGSIWLGEWHTRPGERSRSSRLDLTSYRRLLNDPELAFTFFLTVIVLTGLADGWRHPRLTGWVVFTADVWPLLCRSRIHGGGSTE
ncbi:MAG: hypothetical protein JO242_11645 [Streptosporangiaceae bacterium]|nr:hypothetical protein [Streptosporangiaceae bacterium]